MDGAVAPSPFSTTTPNFQTAWDSTSLGWLKTCPKQYEYHMLLGYHPRALNVHLWFGGLYAAGLERYARWRAEGLTHDEAVREMVKWALCASGTCDYDGVWHAHETNDSVKNRYTLIRSLVWNVDEHEHSPFATVILANGRAAVEYSFRIMDVFEVDGEGVSLCGHLDRVVTEPDGQPWVLDDKTTGGALGANYFRQYSPNGQMSLYTIAARTVLAVPARGVLVRAAQIGVNFTRFQTAQVPRPKAVLDEWLDDTQYWVGQAQSFARRGHWPLNDKSCVAGDTIIKVTRGKMKGRTTTIAQFHSYFNSSRYANFGEPAYALSDLGGYVGLSEIRDVLKQGVKPVLALFTTDRDLYLTEDHLLNTPEGWRAVGSLKEGDEVFAWKDRGTTGRKPTANRVALYGLWYHPYYQPSTKGCVWRYRAVVEASMNNLSLAEFIYILHYDKAKAATLTYLSPDVEVHHKDGNARNDTLTNLEVLTVAEHKREHHDAIVQATNRLSIEKIAMIRSHGREETYDLSIEAPTHNFIANGLVAHNCFLCPFKEVCSVSPTHRRATLDALCETYPWNPLEPRGDL